MTTPDKPMQGLAHPCNNVTAHRGGVFICQAKGGSVGADSFCMACPIVKRPASLADVDAATPASAVEARESWILYLSDRADGVRGHYAIARWNPRGYREVWNLHSHRWSSASDGVLTLAEATELLKNIVIPKGEPPKPPVTICPEQLKPGGCQLHNLQCGWPKCNEPKEAT